MLGRRLQIRAGKGGGRINSDSHANRGHMGTGASVHLHTEKERGGEGTTGSGSCS
jgi:hypothetical protein